MQIRFSFHINSELCVSEFTRDRVSGRGLKKAGGCVVKNPPASAGDVGLMPGSGTSPGGGHGNPLQYFLPGDPMDGGAWWATAQSQTRLWQLSTRAGDSRGSLFPAHLCIKNVILFFINVVLHDNAPVICEFCSTFMTALSLWGVPVFSSPYSQSRNICTLTKS